MSDDTVTGTAAASQSLRDTSKWLVAGVAATAASVFVGSSLTSFGSLSPSDPRALLAADATVAEWRFWLAVAGLAMGFAALAIITTQAVQVLTRDRLSIRDVASSGDAEMTSIVEKLTRVYGHRFPSRAATLKQYLALVDAALAANPRMPEDAALIERARVDNALFSDEASFLFVRNRFDRLVFWLRFAAPAAIVGFGLFAWAANPPEPPSTPPSFSLTIRR